MTASACLLLLCAPLRAAELIIDPKLVDSLANAPEDLMTAHPYIVHFRNGDLDLYYVSGSHERGKNSETCALVQRALRAFLINRLVVEGRPYASGEVTRSSIERIKLDATGKSYEWGEIDCAILAASRRGVAAIGGEPSDKDQLAAVLAAGFEARDFLADGFLKMIPAYRSQGRIAREPLAKLYAETARWDRDGARVPADLKFDYDDFRSWYRKSMGTELDPARIDYAALEPRPDGTVLQRLEEAISLKRNRFLAEILSRELSKHKKILVVYGNGHHAAQRRALIQAMGQPVYEGNLIDSARR